MDEQPRRVTDPSLRDVLAELEAREPIFHRPELGTSAADLERQAAPEFEEVGASGRRYGREFVLATVRERYERGVPDDDWETSDVCCRRVGPETYLLTYDLRQGARLTRRATLWRRAVAGWQVVYHQGTVAG
ncbi:DUF4440 domain-containing protein [Candidatus Blastococcus massiliensis]|uniref:nuclear transport factor 2 family protein n=1 Tax=Candidatus Blastococcus massiliensis TaxID=1470358 RepID=UPI0004AE28A8|nr:DUF4440 domain-containing protein [Candidatus Blastococcus massiliensis]